MFQPERSGGSSFGRKSVPEISEIAEQNGSVLVIPVGSVEQHGDHLPSATDTILVNEVVEASVKRVDDLPLLTTPPVWVGYSPHHLSLGGTVSGEFDTLKSLLEEIATSGLNNGFDALLFVNGHGGNTALVETVVSEVGRHHPTVEVLGLTYFELASDFIDDVRDSSIGGMAHGGEFETSMMLHLHPDYVNDDIRATYRDEPYSLGGDDLMEGGSLSVYREFEEYSASGAIGDPSLASAEKGKEILDGISDKLRDLFLEIHDRN